MAEELIFKSFKKDVFDIHSNIDVIITKVLSEKDLLERWKDIRNHVARTQFDLEDDFERWNFYLFYVVDSPNVDLSLKYEIEHDTISSRKMVIASSKVDDDLYDKLVKEYIRYDIENRQREYKKVFSKNVTVERILKKMKEEV